MKHSALRSVACEIRREVLRMAHAGQTPHVGSALSCVDIIAALYFDCLRIDPADPDNPRRDRFILSKGHGCMAVYATLAQRGFFAKSILSEYALDGGRLAQHPAPHCVPGVEFATGSLGHGLSVGAGLALAAKINQSKYRVFVLLSDGECEEGAVWETALFANSHHLDNLVGIVDFNKWSAMERTASRLDPLVKKWEAFGWRTVEIDGHNMRSITRALETRSSRRRPSAVVAHTVKGKGASFMEDNLEWHYRPPNQIDLRRALAELELTERR
jgi:transketolase